MGKERERERDDYSFLFFFFFFLSIQFIFLIYFSICFFLFLPRYAAINYLVAHCNYGGRVTDDKDRRCIETILTDFYTKDIADDSYRFSPSGTYYAPPDQADVSGYVKYIQSLPLLESPELFGLHDNANLASAMKEAGYLLDSTMSLMSGSGGGGEGAESEEDKLVSLAKDIQQKLPASFDVERVSIDFPVMYEESMNTVLIQELEKFNRLTSIVQTSLRELQRAIKGEVIMSMELEKMSIAMVSGKVPDMWGNAAYESLLPLGSWIKDLILRLRFFQKWIDEGIPAKFWISGFFFTQAFLTGTRQNFARRNTIPIDKVVWGFDVLNQEQDSKIQSGPKDGAYVHGMYLDGATWDDARGVLKESAPKVLRESMNTIHIIPMEKSTLKDHDKEKRKYRTPLYKTSERRGQLSTTGHSTNFVLMFALPMSDEHDEKHWIKRGVAMLTQLDE